MLQHCTRLNLSRKANVLAREDRLLQWVKQVDLVHQRSAPSADAFMLCFSK